MSHLDGKVCQNDVVSVIERGNLKLSLDIEKGGTFIAFWKIGS